MQHQPESDFARLRAMIGKTYKIEDIVKRITDAVEGSDCYIITYGIDDDVSVSNKPEKVQEFIDKHEIVNSMAPSKRQPSLVTSVVAEKQNGKPTVKLQSVNVETMQTLTKGLLETFGKLQQEHSPELAKVGETQVKLTNAILNVGKLELQALRAAENGDV